MDISLVAKMKKYDEFISCYNEGDEKKVYKGKSLLFYSLSNNDTESRYLITDFLLNKGAEVNVINECGENLLHILLSRTKHNIKQTAELCKKLIDKGVNINQLDEKERVPLQYLINLKWCAIFMLISVSLIYALVIFLGGTIPDEDDNDVIAEQLAKISEQMAIKNRRSKKIWKIAGVIFLVIVLLNILLIIFNMSVSKNVSTDSSTTFIEIGEDDVIDVE